MLVALLVTLLSLTIVHPHAPAPVDTPPAAAAIRAEHAHRVAVTHRCAPGAHHHCAAALPARLSRTVAALPRAVPPPPAAARGKALATPLPDDPVPRRRA